MEDKKQYDELVVLCSTLVRLVYSRKSVSDYERFMSYACSCLNSTLVKDKQQLWYPWRNEDAEYAKQFCSWRQVCGVGEHSMFNVDRASKCISPTFPSSSIQVEPLFKSNLDIHMERMQIQAIWSHSVEIHCLKIMFNLIPDDIFRHFWNTDRKTPKMDR